MAIALQFVGLKIIQRCTGLFLLQWFSAVKGMLSMLILQKGEYNNICVIRLSDLEWISIR